MSKRVFINRNIAYSKIKQGQRIVKRKARSGHTVWILRKCKHFYTKKPSNVKSKINKKHGSRYLYRHSRTRKQRSKK